MIVDALKIGPRDVVVEIGPGHGELTDLLLGKKPLRIICVERDDKLASMLQERYSGNPSVSVLSEDILKALPRFAGGRERGGGSIKHPWKLMGNIPYYLTGKLLRVVGELPAKPLRSVLTIQKEVAERLIAQPPRMNRLAASVQHWANPRIVRIVPRSEFIPPPEVDSAIVEFTANEAVPAPAHKGYSRAIRILFKQPRKTILNNILESARGLKKSKTELVEILARSHIDPSGRPGNLSLEDIAALSVLLFRE